MPNAGLPVLDRRRRALPADARASSPTPTTRSPASTASRWSAAAAARRPSTCARSSSAVARPRRSRRAGHAPEPGAASLYQPVPFRQDTAYLSIGERTNANGSKAFREAMLERALGRLRRDRPRPDPRRRAPARPLHRLRRPRRRRRHARARRPARHRVDPADRARLHRAGGHRGRAWRCSAAARVVNSVNYEDGDGPESRYRAGSCRWSREHGAAVVALTIDEEGQARTAEWKVRGRRPADRRPHRQLGHARSRTSSSTA